MNRGARRGEKINFGLPKSHLKLLLLGLWSGIQACGKKCPKSLLSVWWRSWAPQLLLDQLKNGEIAKTVP